MKSYTISYSSKARKFIKKHRNIGLRFYKAFDEIVKEKENIFKYDIKMLKGQKFNNIYRMRIGKYRAIFKIMKKEIIIYVLDIDSRGDIYK